MISKNREKLDFDHSNEVVDLFKVIPGAKNAKEVPEISLNEFQSSKFDSQWVAHNRPCVIRNAVSQSSLHLKWKTQDFWLENVKDFDVAVFPHMNFEKSEREFGEKTMPFHDAVKRLFAKKDFIFSLKALEITKNNQFYKLIPNLPTPKFLKSKKHPRYYSRMRFFLYRRASTTWHYHETDETLLFQFSGKKKVMLLPPKMEKVEYVDDYLYQEKNLDGEDMEKTVNLEPFNTIIEEGDALYIPPYWYHAVTPCDDEVGLSLAFCWRSPWHVLGDFSNYFVRKLYKGLITSPQIHTILLPFIVLYARVSFLIWKSQVKADNNAKEYGRS